MNVRFSDDAVRIRLSANDVTSLLESDEVTCAVYFPNGTRWRCSVNVAAQHAPTVVYAAGHLAIVLPVHELDHWRASEDDDVSARHLRLTMPAGAHRLTLIIEQDLHSTLERS